MVCAHCGSEAHYTGDSKCANYCTLCKETGHRQKRAGCKFRVCSKCGASGHSATECARTGFSECGSTTHKSAMSFACPEHKCTNCEGTLEPKGHNQHCPLAQCESCKLIGHITDVCTFRQCCDVEIAYLNLLLLTKARNTIESYFDATDQASVQPNALRIDGKFSESSDWNHVKQRFAISDGH